MMMVMMMMMIMTSTIISTYEFIYDETPQSYSTSLHPHLGPGAEADGPGDFLDHLHAHLSSTGQCDKDHPGDPKVLPSGAAGDSFLSHKYVGILRLVPSRNLFVNRTAPHVSWWLTILF